MVPWSLSKNQSKIFLNLLTQTIPTALAIFPINFNVLEVGEKKFQVKTSSVATNTKIQKLNVRFRHYSYTIHYTRNDTIHARHDTIHYTPQITCTLHKNIKKHYHNQHIPTQPHLNYTHTHTKTRNTNTLKILIWTKRLVPSNGTKFDRGRIPPN